MNTAFRNDLLIICSLIISIKPDAPGTNRTHNVPLASIVLVIETGFAKQLLLFASYPERKRFARHRADGSSLRFVQCAATVLWLKT